jgi:hypothetical protein
MAGPQGVGRIDVVDHLPHDPHADLATARAQTLKNSSNQ